MLYVCLLLALPAAIARLFAVFYCTQMEGTRLSTGPRIPQPASDAFSRAPSAARMGVFPFRQFVVILRPAWTFKKTGSTAPWDAVLRAGSTNASRPIFSSKSAMRVLAILFAICYCCFIRLTLAVPELPSGKTSSAQNQSKGTQFVPGQVFAGDQLPPELQKAPIVQPTTTGSPPPSASRSIVSFSGYSFNFAPNAQVKGSNWAFAAGQSSQAPPVYNPNPYEGGAILASTAPPIAPRREDAFLLRPAPVEQFLPVLPPPSLPAGKQQQLLAQPPKLDEQLVKFLPPVNSQKPQLTGWVIGIHPPPARPREPFPGGQAIVDPAAYFMEGADLSKIRPPRCSLIGCKGPLPNDFDFMLEQEEGTVLEDRECHRTFVPLNGCMEGRGYPIGMICSICCECTTELATEMSKSRGWAQGYRRP